MSIVTLRGLQKSVFAMGTQEVLGQLSKKGFAVFASHSRRATSPSDRRCGHWTRIGCARLLAQGEAAFGAAGRAPDFISAMSIDFTPRATYKPLHPITISLGWRFFAAALLFRIRYRLE
jgi:hypothetical protein